MVPKAMGESDGKRRRCAIACENCKRRKERCDGNKPCRRCSARQLPGECHYSRPRGGSSLRRNPSVQPRLSPVSFEDTTLLNDMAHHGAGPATASGSQSADSISDLDVAFHQVFRLAHDEQGGGDPVFFGDSANESFVQQIRQLVTRTLGSCPFVDEPVQYPANIDSDASASTSALLLKSMSDRDPASPAKPSPDQAKYLVRWSMRATGGMLGACREEDVQAEVAQWLEDCDDMRSLSTALWFLVLANGALSCPDDEDAIANEYFLYASNLTNLRSTEDPTLMYVLCHSWIALYQLATGRRNAAYQSVGVACRAACAMGLHATKQSAMISRDAYAFRHRLWKALRVLDILTSGPLGRPMCTSESANTKVEQGYSSISDLVAIIDSVLRESYGSCTVSKSFIANITQEHRLWAARMSSGLEADGIESAELIEGCESEPSLAISNIQQGYYWSIMLLTRPLLLERASTLATWAGLSDSHYREQAEVPAVSDSDTAFIYASVDSAVCTVRILQHLLARVGLPKRLSFPVNSAFTAGLTLVVATFADLDRLFPLRPNLDAVAEILQKLEKHNSLACYYRQVIEQLQSTCDQYVEQRNTRILEKQNRLVGGLFGRLHGKPPTPKNKFDGIHVVGGCGVDENHHESLQHSVMGSSLSTICLTDESFLGADTVDAGNNFFDLPLEFSKGAHQDEPSYVENILGASALSYSSFTSFA